MMEFHLYFGPERLPFQLSEGIVDTISAIPFHGIISRGLLNSIASKNKLKELWYKYAPLLFIENFHSIDSGFGLLKEAVTSCLTLSFRQSAIAAVRYLEQNSTCSKLGENISFDVWNIKEGYTSSVWKISRADASISPFILNVARDYEASLELKETSENLMIIGNTYPAILMAKVLEIVSVEDHRLPFPIIVTKNEWINNSFEIHSRKHKITGNDELILVDRFLTDSNDPTFITSVLGRRFTKQETDKIMKGINNFLTAAASCLGKKPSLTINEGDVVWDGEKPVVVAIS